MNQALPQLFGSVIPLFIFCIFAYFYFNSKRKDPVEEMIEPLFCEQCGGRFNQFNLTIPFVRHALYEEFIVIAYGRKRIILGYGEITKTTFGSS